MRFHFLDGDADMEQFVECAKHIEQSIKSENANRKPVKWFVASDSAAHIKALQARFGPAKVIASNGTLGHILYNTEAYKRTILDIEVNTGAIVYLKIY